MSKKLGQILIDRGAITDDQLEAALRNQLMLGGHLGTCLLELGFVDEQHLGDALAEAMRAPYADPTVFSLAQPLVLQSIPKRVVEEYQAVPFRRNDRTLDVAMINPRDLPALDMLAFASECRIVPWVAPEVRVLEAMERLYDIPRRTRYIVISRMLTPLELAIARDAGRSESAPDPSSETDSHVAPGAIASDHGTEYGYGRSWVEVAEELAASDPSLRESPDDATGGDLASRLCGAQDKDAIARAVLAHALESMKRAALFVVRGEEISLWRAEGFGSEISPSKFGTVALRDLALVDLLLGQDAYHGALEDSEEQGEIYHRLGVPPPAEVLLVPVHMNDRLVGLLLGDGGPEGRVECEPRDGLRLARILGLALHLLVLKKKLRDLASTTEHPLA